MGPNEFWQARCLSAVCGLSTVVSFDEEKPPCRAVQGGAGKHRGESEAYTNLAGGWKGGLSRLEGRGKRGPGQNGRCGRVPGSLVVHILTTIAVGMSGMDYAMGYRDDVSKRKRRPSRRPKSKPGGEEQASVVAAHKQAKYPPLSKRGEQVSDSSATDSQPEAELEVVTKARAKGKGGCG